MKNYIGFVYLSLLLVSITFLQTNCSPDNPEEKEMTQTELISRGEYLVEFGGCHDCHTPKKGFNEQGPIFDEARMLSGHPADEQIPAVDTTSSWIHSNMALTAWTGPWGISYAANLTPDGATGLGNWTEEIFMKAMREGKHMGYGRPILPPMPWFSVRNLTDQDLKAVFSYLKSVKPISNKVPEPVSPDKMAQK